MPDSGSVPSFPAPHMHEAAQELWDAVNYFMVRLRDDPNVAYHCGPFTETFERMCRAYAKATGHTEDEIQSRMRTLIRQQTSEPDAVVYRNRYQEAQGRLDDLETRHV